MIDRNRTACFTGHRSISQAEQPRIEHLLDAIIEKLYQQGVIFYGAGGAYGFDMLAEQAVIRARVRHADIRLILVLPCRDQDKYWSVEKRDLFARLLQKADKVVYTDTVYHHGCMYKRNRHLVNYSGYCVAYLTKNSGGTAYTVDYARQNGLQIINLAGYLK